MQTHSDASSDLYKDLSDYAYIDANPTMGPQLLWGRDPGGMVVDCRVAGKPSVTREGLLEAGGGIKAGVNEEPVDLVASESCSRPGREQEQRQEPAHYQLNFQLDTMS